MTLCFGTDFFTSVNSFVSLDLQFAFVSRPLKRAKISALQLLIPSPMGENSKTLAVPADSVAATNLSARTKSRLPLLIGLGVLAALGLGTTVWLVLQRGSPDPPANSTEAATGAPKFVAHLEGFTVNLADPEETHFLRVTMDLGLDHLPSGVSREKVSTAIPVPRVRDSILKVLTVCKADDLLTSAGKAQLKKNLVDSLNRDVPELGVREIYFTEFLVQR